MSAAPQDGKAASVLTRGEVVTLRVQDLAHGSDLRLQLVGPLHEHNAFSAALDAEIGEDSWSAFHTDSWGAAGGSAVAKTAVFRDAAARKKAVEAAHTAGLRVQEMELAWPAPGRTLVVAWVKPELKADRKARWSEVVAKIAGKHAGHMWQRGPFDFAVRIEREGGVPEEEMTQLGTALHAAGLLAKELGSTKFLHAHGGLKEFKDDAITKGWGVQGTLRDLWLEEVRAAAATHGIHIDGIRARYGFDFKPGVKGAARVLYDLSDEVKSALESREYTGATGQTVRFGPIWKLLGLQNPAGGLKAEDLEEADTQARAESPPPLSPASQPPPEDPVVPDVEMRDEAPAVPDVADNAEPASPGWKTPDTVSEFGSQESKEERYSPRASRIPTLGRGGGAARERATEKKKAEGKKKERKSKGAAGGASAPA